MIPTLLLGICAAVTIVALAYVFSNGDMFLVSERYLIAYVGVPAAFLTLEACGLLIRRIRIELLLILIPGGLCFWIAEAWLAANEVATNKTISRIEVAAAAAAATDRPMDGRVQTTVLADLRAEGIDAYPTFSPTTFLLAVDPKVKGEWQPPMELGGRYVLPLTGVANTRSVYCNESGEWLIFSSDRHGFNNPDYVWDQARRKLAILGDSFAQGACVSEGRNAVDLLREKFPGTINLGIAGTGPLIQLALLKEYGPVARPEITVWFFYEGNDLHVNLPIENQFSFLRRYLDPTFRQDLPSLGPEIATFLRDYIDTRTDAAVARDTERKMASISLAQGLKLARLRDRLGLTSCPSKNQDFTLLKTIYAEGKRTVEQWGGRLVIAYLPAWGDMCDLFDPTATKQTWIRRNVLEAAVASELETIDFAAHMAAQGDPSPFFYYRGSHYSEHGYVLLSDIVARFLKEERVP